MLLNQDQDQLADLSIAFCSSCFIIFNFFCFYSEFFGRFDTNRSMIPLSVSEISTLDGFCEEEQEQEWGILVVGYTIVFTVLVQLHHSAAP